MKWPVLEVDIHRPDRYYLFFWKIFGLIPPTKRGLKRNAYFFAYICFHLIFTIGYPVATICKMLQSREMNELFETIYCSLTSSSVALKFISIVFIRKKVDLLLKTAEALNIRAEGESLEMLEKWILYGQKMFIVGAVTVNVPVCILFSTLAVAPTMFLMSFPLDWQNSSLNYFIYTSYQIVMLLVFCYYLFLVNCHTVTLILYYIGHIKALGLRTEGLGFDENMSPSENEEELRNCARDYRNILK